MSSEIVKKHLKEMSLKKGLDKEFIEILNVSNTTDEDGRETATKLLALINKRYVKNKKNNS